MFDVIVIGGGHAGVEAAHAVFRQGLSCCLVTFSRETVGQMSCNPAIGGLGKSHLVREVDALGGIMAQATDMSGIQYRTLNTRKGFAVQALRVQCDRDEYKKAIQQILDLTTIEIIEDEVVDLAVTNSKAEGVVLGSGQTIKAKKIILTTGTFLNGVMYTGDTNTQGGRVGQTTSARAGLAQTATGTTRSPSALSCAEESTVERPSYQIGTESAVPDAAGHHLSHPLSPRPESHLRSSTPSHDRPNLLTSPSI